MQEQALLFFQDHPQALPLYLAFEQRVQAEIASVHIQVKKTQISFLNRHMFACVSFARVKKAAELPDPYLVVTFGLDHRVDAPRIAVAVEPYPNRWTHHVVLSSPQEIDEELMGWVRQASVFSAGKR